jgi:arsenite methyltransferase
MDSLIQLEYIIERERSRATSRQYAPANAVHSTTSNPGAASSARLTAQRYLAMLRAQPGERILDIGCGGGWLSRRLAQLVQPDGQVLGVDSAEAAINLVMGRSAGLSPDVLRFERADAAALPYVGGQFDAAVCVSTLGFCEEPTRVLSEIRRVLRPRGRVLVASSDEGTRIYNAGDRERGRRIERAIANRSRDPWIGRRLAHALVQAGFRVAREVVACDVEHHFQPGLAGYTLANALRRYLVTHGGIDADDYQRWLDDLRAAEWEGSYCYAVTTFTYLAEHE